jgi:membrane fusion protein, multidrug efflux system
MIPIFKSAPLLILILIGCTDKKNEPSKQKAGTAQEPIPVEGIVLKEESFTESLTVTGSLLANEMVEIASEIQGRITHIHFQEGQMVSKGQLLIECYDADVVASLKKASANLDLAEKDWQRKKELRMAKAISIEELEKAENTYQVAQAEKELLQSQLGKHSIVAPFSGKLGVRSVSVGSIVNPGMPLVKLYQLDPIKIEFQVPEKYAPNIKSNSTFQFTGSSSTKPYIGTIKLIDPAIDPSTRTLKIRGNSPNPGSLLSAGAFVSVTLPVFNTQKAIIIPASAINADIKGQKVLLLKEGKISARYVQTGARTEDKVLISEGLVPGDTLITAGLLQLKDGLPATLKKMDEKI